jgi:hypothetical protein
MRHLIKTFLCIGCLALGFSSARAFSLLGPVANGGDTWQVPEIGFNPLASDSLPTGPKNIGEGYRRNSPVMYFAFDPSFGDFFGANGEAAVDQAFQLVNGVMNGQTNSPLLVYGTGTSPTTGFLMGATNGIFNVPLALNPAQGIDSYSASLSEYPLNTAFLGNSAAIEFSLLDVKSWTLWAIMEQLGLADPIRYTWVLHDRYLPPGASCTTPGNWFGGATNVDGVEYLVVMRNFYISPTSLSSLQYTNYINGVLYDYAIFDNCGAAGISPPTADAEEFSTSGAGGPPVASGVPSLGSFFTGLTRDDVAGLRWLYSTNNYDTPSPGYRELPALGSALFNRSLPTILFTSNYNFLVTQSLTNNPITLQGLFPGLQFSLVTSYFSNVVSTTMNFVTNFPIGGVAGQGYVGLQTTYMTNIVQFYQYVFGNVQTNHTYTNTTYALQTITVGPPIGSVVGSPFVTNVTFQPFQSNVPSGDYFVITNGTCPPEIIQTQQTFVNIVTNPIFGVTNADGSAIVQNLISYFTNYALVVEFCELGTNAPADYQGIGRMQFVRVRDDNFDYLSGQFITPITNQYTMVVLTNAQRVTRTFQRVVTTPDFLFAASDQVAGPAALPVINTFSRNVNFNQADIQTALAGPGTIDPASTLTFNKAGPIYFNFASTNGITPPGNSPGISAAAQVGFVWGSFDASTNLPIVYPNGTSLTNLQAASLVQISPPPPMLPPARVVRSPGQWRLSRPDCLPG